MENSSSPQTKMSEDVDFGDATGIILPQQGWHLNRDRFRSAIR
jgi:hypothetical protein